MDSLSLQYTDEWTRGDVTSNITDNNTLVDRLNGTSSLQLYTDITLGILYHNFIVT